MATDEGDLHAVISELLDLYLDATDGGPWPRGYSYGEKSWRSEGEPEYRKACDKWYNLRVRVEKAQRHLCSVAAQSKFQVPDSWLTVRYAGGCSPIGTEDSGIPELGRMYQWEEYGPDLDALQASITEMTAAEKKAEALPAAKPEQGAGNGGDDTGKWITVSEAARITNINKGNISRAADSSEIITNGEQGRARRLDAFIFCRWVIQRSPSSEPSLSGEELIRRSREERRKRGVVDDD